MRLSSFSTGRVREKRGTRGLRRYLSDAWAEETLPVNVFLIDHPAGLCLVDAGQSAAATRPGYFPPWPPYFRLARFELTAADEAAGQLARVGVDPARVRWVVLTHLHTDHVGGIAAFRKADVIVGRDEWTRGEGIAGRLRGYLPHKWPSGLKPRVVDFDGPAVGPFAGSYDVAGDGSLLFVPLAGHTPGHAGLLVGRPGAYRYLCAGDAAHRAAELSATAPAIAAWCRREGIDVLPTHDDAATDLAVDA